MWRSLIETENPNKSAAQAAVREIRLVSIQFDPVPKWFLSFLILFYDGMIAVSA
jgi:hypothetical protein